MVDIKESSPGLDERAVDDGPVTWFRLGGIARRVSQEEGRVLLERLDSVGSAPARESARRIRIHFRSGSRAPLDLEPADTPVLLAVLTGLPDHAPDGLRRLRHTVLSGAGVA